MEPVRAQNEMLVTTFKFSKRVILKSIVGRSDGGVALVGQKVVIGGWVRASREVKKDPPVQPPREASVEQAPKDVSCVEVLQSQLPFFRSIIRILGGGNDQQIREKLDAAIHKAPQPMVSALQISDGSCVPTLLVTVDSAIAPPAQVMPTGTSIMAEGVLQQPSVQGKHVVELKVEKLLHVGTVDQEKYPLTRKRLPLETLRDSSHFRPRTTTVASVTRIHNALTQGTHTFFQNYGFLYVQVPIITCTDTEGFSKKFHVTTLFNKETVEGQIPEDNKGAPSLDTIKSSIEEKSKQVEAFKRSESNREALVAAVQDLKRTNELVAQLEAREKAKLGKFLKPEKINLTADFFSREAYLTVSGRLHLEAYACALGNVYTFGPRFVAEKSESKRSLAEMWMVELEMAFTQLEDAMDCAAEFLKFMCKWILDNCTEDLEFVAKRIDKTVVDRLQSTVSNPFGKISYAEAVETLKKVTKKKFEAKVEYGVPLTEELESYLAEEIYKKPVIIYNHPKELKPFHVRLNDDGKTVAAFDIVVPKIGNLIRGNQGEERFDMLVTRMKELGLSRQEYEWFLDLRKHGAVKQSGFSVVLDTLIPYATGLNDVKDCIPFPRSYRKANN